MDIKLIRNATLRVTYSGRGFLIDPFLMPKHSIESFAGISPNPLVDLPCTPNDVVDGIEMVVISHLHPDHFDLIAQQLIPDETQVFCQPSDETMLKGGGFQTVTAINNSIVWEGITITRTSGQHGTGIWLQQMGSVSGFVFDSEDEPTVYWAGDTIMFEGVRQVLREKRPNIIITHSGGARFPGSEPIIMDDEQTIALCKDVPYAIVIAVHMEALDHCSVSRVQLRELAEQYGIGNDRLLIPSDGETICL